MDRNRVLVLGVVLSAVVAWKLIVPAPSPSRPVVVRSWKAVEPDGLEDAGPGWNAVGPTKAEAPHGLVLQNPAGVADPAARVSSDASIDADALVDALIEELISAEGPLFHRRAVELLEKFSAGLSDAEGESRHAVADRVLSRLEGWHFTPRVRGALLALLGAWGRQADVLESLPMQGEQWRSAMAGLSWSLDGDRSPWGRPGVRLVVDELLEVLGPAGALGGLSVLPLEYSRRPDEELAAALSARVTTVAGDFEGLADRTVSLLALGTSIDDDAGVLGTFRELLFSSEPVGYQVRYTVLFVLTRARSRAARRVVQEFVDDDQAGGGHSIAALHKAMARVWLADHPDAAAEFDRMAASLLDDAKGHFEKIGSLTGLAQTLELLSSQDTERAEHLLAELSRHESHPVVRLSALGMLSDMNGGAARLAALDHALRTDSNATARLLASRGLGKTPSPFSGEAMALLRRHLPDESDEQVIREIRQLLDLDG